MRLYFLNIRKTMRLVDNFELDKWFYLFFDSEFHEFHEIK